MQEVYNVHVEDCHFLLFEIHFLNKLVIPLQLQRLNLILLESASRSLVLGVDSCIEGEMSGLNTGRKPQKVVWSGGVTEVP